MLVNVLFSIPSCELSILLTRTCCKRRPFFVFVITCRHGNVFHLLWSWHCRYLRKPGQIKSKLCVKVKVIYNLFVWRHTKFQRGCLITVVLCGCPSYIHENGSIKTFPYLYKKKRTCYIIRYHRLWCNTQQRVQSMHVRPLIRHLSLKTKNKQEVSTTCTFFGEVNTSGALCTRRW